MKKETRATRQTRLRTSTKLRLKKHKLKIEKKTGSIVSDDDVVNLGLDELDKKVA